MDLRKYDHAFSVYKRLKDRIQGTQLVKCCCCGKVIHWKNSQNAHYTPRKHLATRYDEHNCHACCEDCNCYKGGNLPKYKAFLKSKYGSKEVERLEKAKFETVKLSKSYLDEMLKFWNAQIKIMTK